jgi:molecular chaperone DnaK (HSP70)
MARIEVRFLIDANGILNVTARDARTGREQSVDVTPSYGLTNDQVEAMIEASIDHAEDDYQAAQLASARVDADAILAAVDKAKRNEAWIDLTDDERRNITAAINRLQLVYHSGDHNLIRERIDALNEVTHHLAENIMNAVVRSALRGTQV